MKLNQYFHVLFVFFLKNPWKIFRYIHLLFLLFGWATQTRKKESCMYFPCQLFFKTPHETLKFQQKSCHWRQKKYKQTWQNGVFSTDIHWKKIMFTNYAFAVRKSVRNAFSDFLETWILKFFPSLSTLGIPRETVN